MYEIKPSHSLTDLQEEKSIVDYFMFVALPHKCYNKGDKAAGLLQHSSCICIVVVAFMQSSFVCVCFLFAVLKFVQRV